jgi:hypothetical protein
MIPEEVPAEAVEAAAKTFLGYTPEHEADDLEREINAACRSTAKRILEAAAPFIAAEAFEQGQKSAFRHATRLAAAVRMGRPDLPGPMSPNPYRAAAVRGEG